jgi:DNA-directed RNA polymerase specialized sigma24 family protein
VENLLSGAPTAREAIAVRYLPLLCAALAGTHRQLEADLRDTAAEDAVFDLIRHPDRFDASRGGLGAYLRMAARRDLANAVEAERRRRRGIALDSVEEPPAPRNTEAEPELTWNDPRLVAELAVMAPDEVAAVELLRGGARRTATFARRVGLSHLSAGEQAAAVKRLKDRVKKRLARAVEDTR